MGEDMGVIGEAYNQLRVIITHYHYHHYQLPA